MWTMFALWLFWVVYASNWISSTYHAWDNSLTAQEWTELTLSKWNELISKVRNIATNETGELIYSWPTPTSNTALVTKSYVDAQVQASTSGSASCPAQISALQTADTLLNAVKGCRAMGGWYRLPTFEELSCFIWDTTISWWATSHELWSRTDSTIWAQNYWLTISLSQWSWLQYMGSSSISYRCVR